MRTQTENILSLNSIVQKLASHHADSRQVGWRFRGVITAEIPIIHRILKISDPTTFPTHISYFFLIIAASVAATSGSDVQAATIVAQIAHSETQNVCAINTAAFTTKSEDITKVVSCADNKKNLFSDDLGFLLRKREINNHRRSIHRNIHQ